MATDPPDRVRFRVTREALGLTQAQWGAVLDVHGLTVSKWERGLLTPNDRAVAIVTRLQDKLAVEVARLGVEIRAALESAGALEAFRLLLEATR